MEDDLCVFPSFGINIMLQDVPAVIGNGMGLRIIPVMRGCVNEAYRAVIIRYIPVNQSISITQVCEFIIANSERLYIIYEMMLRDLSDLFLPGSIIYHI